METRKAEKRAAGTENPYVDVIIPTYRPGREVRELLERLLMQTLPPGRIFLVNTEKEYFDEELTEGLPRISVCHIPKASFDHGGTRQMSLSLSDARYVLFMTQDALPVNRKLIEELVRAIREPHVRAAYARQLPNLDAGAIERYTRFFNYPPEPRVKTLKDLPELGLKTFFCSNVCALYDREYLVSSGGFTVPCIFNEDMIFASKAVRAGEAIAYAAEAKVIHSHNYSALRQFHRNFDNGASQALHPEAFSGVGAAGEGKRLVLSTLRYLLRTGRPLLVPRLICQSAAKMAGFYLGKQCRRLPAFMVRRFTDNPSFWEKDHEEKVRRLLS